MDNGTAYIAWDNVITTTVGSTSIGNQEYVANYNLTQDQMREAYARMNINIDPSINEEYQRIRLEKARTKKKKARDLFKEFIATGIPHGYTLYKKNVTIYIQDWQLNSGAIIVVIRPDKVVATRSMVKHMPKTVEKLANKLNLPMEFVSVRMYAEDYCEKVLYLDMGVVEPIDDSNMFSRVQAIREPEPQEVGMNDSTFNELWRSVNVSPDMPF